MPHPRTRISLSMCVTNFAHLSMLQVQEQIFEWTQSQRLKIEAAFCPLPLHTHVQSSFTCPHLTRAHASPSLSITSAVDTDVDRGEGVRGTKLDRPCVLPSQLLRGEGEGGEGDFRGGVGNASALVDENSKYRQQNFIG